jgi:redox-sensitive bicupin YhaK (pirin superfamily)
MPAVSVANRLELPKVVVVDPTQATARPVTQVTTAPRGFEGKGFPVRRAFAGVTDEALDPFIHMDQMGEIDYGPGEPKGTSWHPHRGFETVTYMIEGTFEHDDSIGGGGVIANGATQWMTAGAGILHIEKPPETLVMSGGLFHGIQLWVNLPSAKKMVDPRYQDLLPDDVGLATTPDGGALLRVIAGDLGPVKGPGSTLTPISLVHASISPGAEVRIPWNKNYNALAYVLAGDGTVGEERRPVTSGQLTVFGAGDTLVMTAADVQDSRTAEFEVLILGGEPIREPVAKYGPFVMNTRAELIQAFEDFEAGRLGTIPARHDQ